MKLIRNSQGRIDYEDLNAATTVQEVLEAVDEFLKVNPLSCELCEESCCKKAWSVEMDNICVKRLNEWEDESCISFVENKLIKKKNYYRDFYQFVLDKEKNCTYITEENLCRIYERRPIICRLYICSPKSYRYNLLRELIGSTYLKALVLEDRLRRYKYTPATVKKYRKNPAVSAVNYESSLEDIFLYSFQEGWIDEEEYGILYGTAKESQL